ncbi:sulfide/dihydroorotate dehydrogenase-like FAD/NAD-binding protein [Fusibacter sp. 3D3]|uniref:sulfide/dihydroorotate dehydrogenase-like FAD/NAD-binding protein n=1 Tax=Fusibacter sp. 3D3 TaxID=1048380 RepID=UPI000852A7F5|nr:sulfide/dihydroorotate dehydrogenase-like FAD/NAD-binding protein [Fusibacter sp. 3D3]GAU76695.1 hydrogenase, subunit gamma related protein [Fusibacter sp. 3D3]
MYKIVLKETLATAVVKMMVHAPYVARKAKAGQFIILRVHENSERIPLTIADYNREEGLITIIYQVVGKATMDLNNLEEGDYIHDFVGPLGKPSEIENLKKAIVVGGGVGCAIAYPIVKALAEQNTEVYSVVGFRNKEMVILEDEFASHSDKRVLMSDDGSYGSKGFVTTGLEGLLEEHKDIDCVFAIGPIIMMKNIAAVTRKYGVKTVVSMNSIMIDGTGMCGGCRLTVGGETKFACVDGPEFDGHLVDFDEAQSRNNIFKNQPAHSFEEDKTCQLLKEVENGK